MELKAKRFLALTLYLIFTHAYILSSAYDIETIAYTSTPPFVVHVWVNKGCGAEYTVGESITVFFSSNRNATVELIAFTSSGASYLFVGNIIENEIYTWMGNVGTTPGEVLYVLRGWNNTDYCEDSCLIYVVEISGTLTLIVREKQSNISLNGVKVYLNGSLQGETGEDGTFTIAGLETGVYNLTLKKTGYYTWKGIVQIHPGQTTEVSAYMEKMPEVGDLKILVVEENTLQSIPNAQIYIDDQMKGTTGAYGSITINNLQAGPHTITVIAEGYQTYESTIMVKKWKLNTFMAKLKPITQPPTTPPPTTQPPTTPPPTTQPPTTPPPTTQPPTTPPPTTQPPTTPPPTTQPPTTPPPTTQPPARSMYLNTVIILAALVIVLSIALAVLALKR